MTTNAQRRIASFRVVLVALVSIGIAACGGADAPAPKSPDTKPGLLGPKQDSSKEEALGEPQSIEEAQKQIADLRASIDSRRSLDTESRPEKPSANQPDTSQPSSTRRPTDPPKATTPGAGGGAQPRDDAKTASSSAEDMCVSPCRALASMKRAVDALCRMTGDSDTRCVDAKKTLSESTTRVATCKCESR